MKRRSFIQSILGIPAALGLARAAPSPEPRQRAPEPLRVAYGRPEPIRARLFQVRIRPEPDAWRYEVRIAKRIIVSPGHEFEEPLVQERCDSPVWNFYLAAEEELDGLRAHAKVWTDIGSTRPAQVLAFVALN